MISASVASSLIGSFWYSAKNAVSSGFQVHRVLNGGEFAVAEPFGPRPPPLVHRVPVFGVNAVTWEPSPSFRTAPAGVSGRIPPRAFRWSERVDQFEPFPSSRVLVPVEQLVRQVARRYHGRGDQPGNLLRPAMPNVAEIACSAAGTGSSTTRFPSFPDRPAGTAWAKTVSVGPCDLLAAYLGPFIPAVNITTPNQRSFNRRKDHMVGRPFNPRMHPVIPLSPLPRCDPVKAFDGEADFGKSAISRVLVSIRP